jgi:DNA-binding NarL/FixJ family response regulator
MCIRCRRGLKFRVQDSILKHMAQGLTRKQITSALHFENPMSFNYYWKQIVKRFGTKSHFKIALIARDDGIV